MKLNPINIFNDWAKIGKDEGMAKAHEPSVLEILQYIYKLYDTPYSFLDAGCGNGWVVRKVASQKNCTKAIGIDGAKKMIEKAKLKDPSGSYFCTDLMNWEPQKKVDIVHSMEVVYYFRDPEKIIKHMVKNWINSGGLLIAGMDHYIGNPKSYSWSEDLNVHMALMSGNEWKNIFSNAGLKNCEFWKTQGNDNAPGTLVVSGTLPRIH